MVRFPHAVLLLVSLTVTAGCQRKPQSQFVPIEGTLTRGGKPLADVIVVFWGDPDGESPLPPSSGVTDAAGHFRLHTDQGDEGAAVGRHRVCLLDRSALPNRMHAPTGEPARRPTELSYPSQSSIPSGYSRREETPLRVEVRPEEPIMNLEVK